MLSARHSNSGKVFSFVWQWFLPVSLCLFMVLVQCKEMPVEMLSGSHDSGAFVSHAPTLPGGAFYEFSVPDNWDDLVIYVHGYVNAQEELDLPADSVEGQSVADIVNKLGMAYGTTSFRSNGLLGPEAVEDLVQLTDTFVELYRSPRRIYLVGVSQGGMITTLAMEQHPEVFSGGLAGCGPIGSFTSQVNYLGDFHVLLNYFFPELNLGDPEEIPDSVIDDWLTDGSSLREQVRNVLTERPEDARKLLRIGEVPIENDTAPEEIVSVVFNVLRYNILGTNNAIERLNGLPFDNTDREYTGSGSALEDSILNSDIGRFQADASSTITIENEFETSGGLTRPLVTIHTTGDEEVPYLHVTEYQRKLRNFRNRLYYSNLRINRYGHCNFTLPEALAGFAILVAKVSLHDLIVPISIFPDKQAEEEFLELSREQGVNPVIQPEPEPIIKEIQK